MAKTYIDLVNIVLRDLNEVPLGTGNFDMAVGFQAFIKEAVNRALLDIINYNDEWPWLAAAPASPGVSPHTHVFPTVIDQFEYAFPADVGIVDYDNVVLVDTEDNDIRHLQFVDFDTITRQPNQGSAEPRLVYKTPNDDYLGIFPQPDKVYQVKYVSWKLPTTLNLATDEIPFEERYYPTVVSRARYYAWMFRENVQQAQVANNEYEFNLKKMYKNIMLPEARQMRAV